MSAGYLAYAVTSEVRCAGVEDDERNAGVKTGVFDGKIWGMTEIISRGLALKHVPCEMISSFPLVFVKKQVIVIEFILLGSGRAHGMEKIVWRNFCARSRKNVADRSDFSGL